MVNSRETIISLLSRDIPERMGLFEHFWPETLRDVWPDQGYPKGEKPEDYFDLDIVPCADWVNSEPFMGRHEVLDETDDWELIRNGRGARLRLWKHKSGTPEHVGFEVTTPQKWAEYREPLLATDLSRLGDMEAARRKMEDCRANGKFAVTGNHFVFEALRSTVGDENFLAALALDPEWIHDFCKVYLDFFIRHYEIFFREAGVPDGFFLYEDLAYGNGLFCSPAMLGEFVMPYLKEFVSFLKSYGIPVIMHTCGDIRKAIPMIIDAGIDCLQPMEAKAGCNVLDIAAEFGSRLTYMGNIDMIALSTNDRTRIEAEILPKLSGIKALRVPYIFHSDHSVPPTVSLDTYKHCLDLYRSNSSYASAE